VKARAAAAPAPTSRRSCSWSDGRRSRVETACANGKPVLGLRFRAGCEMRMSCLAVLCTLLPFFLFLVGDGTAVCECDRGSRQAVKRGVKQSSRSVHVVGVINLCGRIEGWGWEGEKVKIGFSPGNET